MVDFPGKEKYGVDDLRAVVEILRGPEGCPWDRVQDHVSLRRELLEETAETVEAIDRADSDMLLEELGDVLLQVIFHASLEQQAGRFTLDDVADRECRKMIARHPHVFGSVTVSGVEDELEKWEDAKRLEKSQRTASEAMDAVCRTLPGLWRAEKIQKKAAHGRAETADADSLCRELSDAALALGETLKSGSDALEALGELLFTAVRCARSAGTDPEAALHERCEKAIRQQRALENAPE